ncbi:SUKH-4 immunity protein-domain-containing protein [Aspergillus transmontanensis]|uniref:SUKH-4 immunity protein-domain-containing protein n=1 Tax=Aspergillus transmontanensis TaxID=1034304 RepID=A0A5N6W6Y7_9EURO|nr:SUKH-4 immunity protein-domain-containing protein [Aspergillus transmontanensis]
MPGFLSLPTELIFEVYCSLDTIGDAYFLSQTCQQTYSIFSRPQSQPRIFESIIDNIIHDAAPTKAWLEEQFGPGSLWQPTEAELPVDLTDKETIEFLLDVGFPSVNLPRMGFESTDLKKFAGEGERIYGCTAYDLYTMFDPDDFSEVPALSFCFGDLNYQLAKLNNKNSVIFLYEPGAGHYMDCNKGSVAFGLDSFAVLLGMVVAVTKDLRKASPDICPKELERRAEVLGDYDFLADEDSEFWDELFSNLLK